MRDTLTSSEQPAEFPVHNYIEPVSIALDTKAQGTSGLRPEVAKFLYGFNEFNLENHVQNVGEKEARARVAEAQRLYEDFNVVDRLQRILARVQELQPGVEIQSFPFYFFYAGKHGGGFSNKGTIVGVNLGEAVDKMRKGVVKDQEEALDRNEKICMHEGVHVFMTQLGVGSQDTRVPLFGGLWGEGLTTYMVPELLRDYTLDEDELMYWMDMLYLWMQASNQKERGNVVKRYLEPENNKYVDPDLLGSLKNRLENDEYPAVVLSDMLLKSKGRIYRIGQELWKERVAKGESLPDLVRAGPDQFEVWVKEYVDEKKRE